MKGLSCINDEEKACQGKYTSYSHTLLWYVMTRPRLLQLSKGHISKDMAQPLYLLWRLGGGSYCVHKKSQNFVAANTVPITVVPRTFIQAPVFLARRIRQQLVESMSVDGFLILASLTPSQFFCPLGLFSLSARRWLSLENAHSPITAQINLCLHIANLDKFRYCMSQD